MRPEMYSLDCAKTGTKAWNIARINILMNLNSDFTMDLMPRRNTKAVLLVSSSISTLANNVNYPKKPKK